MTTDTAVRVTRTVIEKKGNKPLFPCVECIRRLELCIVPLKDIKYVDHPELRIDEHESTEMPFRYMAAHDGSPIMPKVCVYLLHKHYELVEVMMTIE